MSEFANVESVAAIARFRVALIQFEEESTNTLDQLERQAQKFLHWLEADTATFWRLEVLRCHEKISRARSALDTAMMRKTKDFRPACIEEKDNLRFAKDRLAMAEEKTEKVRRWARVVREEVEEYRGQLNRLRDGLGVQIPRGVALLDRTLRALEKYTELAPPPAQTAPVFVTPGEMEGPKTVGWEPEGQSTAAELPQDRPTTEVRAVAGDRAADTERGGVPDSNASHGATAAAEGAGHETGPDRQTNRADSKSGAMHEPG